jgi:hypothetical protein
VYSVVAPCREQKLTSSTIINVADILMYAAPTHWCKMVSSTNARNRNNMLLAAPRILVEHLNIFYFEFLTRIFKVLSR